MNFALPKIDFKFTKKTQIVIGIVIAVLIPCVLFAGGYFGYRACFPENERLVISEIRLVGPSSFWNPSDPNENFKRRMLLMDALSLQLGKTKMFAVNLADFSQKISKEYPSLESVYIYRELPDRLIFDLRERIPVANMLGMDAYLDEKGCIVSKSQYTDLDGTIPDIVIVGEQGKAIKYLPGDDLSENASLRMARDLIRITRLDIPDVRITRIVIFQNNSSMDCTFLYQEDPTPYIASFPDKQNEDKIKSDLIPRLLAVLRDPTLMNKSKRSFNFRWENSVIVQ